MIIRGLFQLERFTQLQIVGGIAYPGLKQSWLSLPACCGLVVEAEGVLAKSDADVLALARLQTHLAEAFQLLERTVDRGLGIVHIELYGLRSGSLTDVLYLYGEGDGARQLSSMPCRHADC